MGSLGITINQRDYVIGCDPGQEQHLRGLARYIDQKIAELVQAVGQVGESRLLVMACLVVADQLAEAQAEIERLRAAPGVPADPEGVTLAMDALARRIEVVAERLERA